MSSSTVKRLIIGGILVVAALLVLQSIYYTNIYLEKKSNHDKVAELIDNALQYSPDTIDEEIDEINNLLDTKHFDNASKGRLYERASLIYMQLGETMSYYRYLGYALYYLERSDEKDYTVNIYLDLANFFLNNYDKNSAEEMIDEAVKVEAFEDIESLQIKSYAYRMLAILAIYDQDYAAAEELLNLSIDTVNQSHTNQYEESYIAINETWLARVYVETGRYQECQEILDKWNGNDMFTTDIYRQIFLRDLIIPYYQTAIYLDAARTLSDIDNLSLEERSAREEEILGGLDQLIYLCESNGFEKAELSTLLKLQTDYPPQNEEVRQDLYDKMNNLYTSLFENQNLTYTNVIDNVVSDSKTAMIRAEKNKTQYRQRTEFIVFTLMAIGWIMLLLAIIIFNNRFDGLTQLLSRKTFNKQLQKCNRSSLPYGIIMIDIDNFKQINDTYGHQNGDIVLQHVGRILRRENTPDVKCFRYGGEEFVILLNKSAIPYAKALAHRLRGTMEQQGWAFNPDLVITLSIGVAIGDASVDVLKEADEKLYYSKNHGKNKVTF